MDPDDMVLDTPDWMKEFNENSHLHHVIMYAGEYDIDRDVLKQSKISHPSAEVIDFTKTQIVHAKASIMKDGRLYEKVKEDGGLYEKGCGTEKGCFGIPRGCIQYATCKLLVTYKKIAPSSATLGKIPKLRMQMKVGYIVIYIDKTNML